MRKIRFYYDVVCPYSYMESHLIETAEDSGEVHVEWLPFELRPAPAPAPNRDPPPPGYQPRSTLPLAACLWAGDQGRLREFTLLGAPARRPEFLFLRPANGV